MTDRELVAELKRRQYSTLLEHSPDAIVVVDSQARICEWNPAAEAMLGPPRDAVMDAVVRSLLPEGRQDEFDTAWAELVGGRPGLPPSTFDLRREGTVTFVRVLAASIQARGSFAGAVAILRNDSVGDGAPALALAPTAATPLPAADFRAAVLARPSRDTAPDRLTGLPSRRDLEDRLAEPVMDGWFRGVAALDIDALGSVNEVYGAEAFDDVIEELARRLTVLTTGAHLGRWQTEVFVWVVDTQDRDESLDDLSSAVITSLHEPFHVGGDRLQLTPSVGLATSATVPVADLLPAAMSALRAAKNAGHGRAAWFSEEMPTGAVRLGEALRHGIEDDELRLHYQPIVDLTHDTVVGVEALVRWERPGVGLLSPASFIEVAERTGQIVDLGAWVARTACRAAVDLRPAGRAPFSVSINVSARQLGDPGLIAMLERALSDAGCPPEALVVEITETALMDDLGAAAVTLDAIKAMGVRLDLDDFGTGYSSLLYLRTFPVDRIKIDQSFVAGLGTDYADTTIVASTIALAHAVGIGAIAEGVETSGQLELLRQMGCDFAQGYVLSRPIEADAFTRWLAIRGAGSAARGGGPARGAARDQDGHIGDATPRDRVAVSLDVGRDGLADERDVAADRRDGAADRRDAVADLREQLADLRDGEAVERDDSADHRGGILPGARAGLRSPGAVAPQPEPSDAPTLRSLAANLRAGGADGRERARRKRDDAALRRKDGVARRQRSEQDRRAAAASTSPQATDTGAGDATVVEHEPDEGPPLP